MSYAESRNRILAARDRRQELLENYLEAGYPATLFLSLNIPGEEKEPPGAGPLFSWAIRALTRALPGLVNLCKACDALGPHGIMLVELEATEVKRRCISIEASTPFARLVDLDVYDNKGIQAGRASLGLPPRPCIVCGMPAVDCIRTGRHASAEVIGRTYELLAQLGH